MKCYVSVCSFLFIKVFFFVQFPLNERVEGFRRRKHNPDVAGALSVALAGYRNAHALLQRALQLLLVPYLDTGLRLPRMGIARPSFQEFVRGRDFADSALFHEVAKPISALYVAPVPEPARYRGPSLRIVLLHQGNQFLIFFRGPMVPADFWIEASRPPLRTLATCPPVSDKCSRSYPIFEPDTRNCGH